MFPLSTLWGWNFFFISHTLCSKFAHHPHASTQYNTHKCLHLDKRIGWSSSSDVIHWKKWTWTCTWFVFFCFTFVSSSAKRLKFEREHRCQRSSSWHPLCSCYIYFTLRTYYFFKLIYFFNPFNCLHSFFWAKPTSSVNLLSLLCDRFYSAI